MGWRVVQLTKLTYCPTQVAVMKNCGKYVICDRGNERSRMQIFTKHGHFVRKIAIRYRKYITVVSQTFPGQVY